MLTQIVAPQAALPIASLVVVVYGVPGSGKTTLAMTAEKPLVLDFDGGAARAIRRADVLPVSQWSDVSKLKAAEIASQGYSTVVVDTAGRALDSLTNHLIATDPRNARASGALQMNGWQALKIGFKRWLTDLRGDEVDVVLVCHAKEEIQGDDVVVRLDMPGGSKDEVYKEAHVMGQLSLRDDGKRVFDCTPRHGAFGKDPGQWGPVGVGAKNAGALAKLMRGAKRHLGRPAEFPDTDASSADAKADSQKRLTEWNAKLATLAGAGSTKEEKKAFLADAKKAGYVLDRTTKKLVSKYDRTMRDTT